MTPPTGQARLVEAPAEHHVGPHEDDGEHAPADENSQDGEGKPELSETVAGGAFVRGGHAGKLSEPAVTRLRPPGTVARLGQCSGMTLERVSLTVSVVLPIMVL